VNTIHKGSEEFLLDIDMPAYNHENYISQAIESVLEQKTNFKFRLIIGEDCSTDNTRAIVEKYRKLRPDIIYPIYQQRNVGASENGKMILSKCTSKYLAILEGDDYWIDLNKLQKQVEFLEENHEFVGCSSNVFEKKGDTTTAMAVGKNIITLNDLIQGNCIYTCSSVFRNTFKLPEWYGECKMGDWIIWLLLTQNGYIYNFDEQMAVYRVHNNSIWGGRGKEKNFKDMIATYNILLEKFNPNYKKELKAGAKNYYNQLLNILAEKKSMEIFYWLRTSFFHYYDFRQFRYLKKYFKNIVLPSRSAALPVKE
jgi:glycosyltransferase involved in cell wall biosynthesis